jgi:acetyltransferase-like isoleucine patch superfamily enzyme
MGLLSNLVDRLYVRFARGGEYESEALRRRFRERHDLTIGLYSYGCFDRWRFPPGTSIGRWCSFAKSVRFVEADHPLDALTTHPYLYLPEHALAKPGAIKVNRQQVEDDVWVGHNAIVLPGCSRIGRGAVIGAGTIVRADVPPYAIVAGVPGKIVRYRFPDAVIAAIEATRWWELDRAILLRGLKAVPEFAWQPGPDSAARFMEAVGARN